ncbi:MAG: ATP-dependent Clp protease adaptor ClpS [Bacteroidetes bacterium]|nr:ATP-dependent Clp protease adaptor ClpS [Bacteroidia bacterium]MBN8697072.1 ATP-dependent Clp protease adaptor ClpS [Bacteroidota bacterium]MCK6650469.1 ATP-dependent Clp protease adaptor ClpS [Bacteroidia bacterium]
MRNFDKKEHELDTDSDVLLAPEEVEVADKQIILYNDDFNTFDFVIESLIKVCKHDTIQAEQCTYLVHYKGKCSVKRGSYEALEPMCTALLERGLTAEIE